ncbi:hypothetical protein N9F08_00555 [bacterium]|nr:hypothetical protein [bacterium]
MKSLFNSGNEITKKEQKSINGGFSGIICYARYIAKDGGNQCAVQSNINPGAPIYGTIQNGLCCVSKTVG